MCVKFTVNVAAFAPLLISCSLLEKAIACLLTERILKSRLGRMTKSDTILMRVIIHT